MPIPWAGSRIWAATPCPGNVHVDCADIPVPAWSNHVTVWATNGAGSMATAPLVVFNDIEPPRVTNAFSAPPMARAGSVAASLSFTKPMTTSTPLVVRYEPDMQAFTGTFVTTRTWMGAAPVVSGNDGVKTVSVSNGIDIVGIGLDPTGGLASFTVDTTPPTVSTLLSPADSSYWGSTTATLQWLPGTDSNGIAGVQVATNGAARLLGATNAWSVSVRQGGTYRWAVRTIDGAGNTSAWSETWQFTIDTNVPVVALLSPSNGMITNACRYACRGRFPPLRPWPATWWSLTARRMTRA